MDSNYKELLNHIEWKKKRKAILKLHSFECQNCGNSEIINNCLNGEIISIKRKRTLLELLNRSDPRFNYEYEIEFKDTNNKSIVNQIFANYNYANEELSCFIGSTLFYSFEQKLSFLNSRSNFHFITCIPDQNKNKWFYVKQLEVHHTYYEKGLKPWEYPDDSLKTLCWICHKKEHQ